jgi:hypothetical protein
VTSERADPSPAKARVRDDNSLENIPMEVKSKPPPFEKRKGYGTQALHPSDVSVSDKNNGFLVSIPEYPIRRTIERGCSSFLAPGCLTPDPNF